jgi:hypothetical protein
MNRAAILAAVRREFGKHKFDYFEETVPNSSRPNTVRWVMQCASAILRGTDSLYQRLREGDT